MFFRRVLDHDTYSANDAIGKIYVDLNPLLTKDPLKVISGWFPIYDTMHGMERAPATPSYQWIANVFIYEYQSVWLKWLFIILLKFVG